VHFRRAEAREGIVLRVYIDFGGQRPTAFGGTRPAGTADDIVATGMIQVGAGVNDVL